MRAAGFDILVMAVGGRFSVSTVPTKARLVRCT
jgi:hypothetical protein